MPAAPKFVRLGLAMCAAACWFASAAPARGCPLPPAARVRTSIPADGDAKVPTSVRPRVAYIHGAWYQAECGAGAPPAPLLRRAAPDGGLPDGGDDVPGAWTMQTDLDPRAGWIWQFRPAAPLLPDTTYEMVDTYPESCMCTKGGCPPQGAAVFARFTTGAGPDVTPPVYRGLVGTLCVRDTCKAGDVSCCGPYDHLRLEFVDVADPIDENLVGTRYYARKDGESYDFTRPQGPGRITDPVDGLFAPRWNMTFSPGTWHVLARAFDSSGNEDANMEEVTFTFPLASGATCAAVFYDASVPKDLAIASRDLAKGDTADGGGAGNMGGCTCRVGRAGRGAGPGGLAAIGLVAAIGARRRRRQRSSSASAIAS